MRSFSNSSRSLKRNNVKEGKIKIVISDTGIGIPQDVIQNLFQPFYQAGVHIARHFQLRNYYIRQYGGTGLGLWISKNIIKLMKGEISISSEIGVGSTFTIEFPASVCPEIDIIKDANGIDLTIDLLKSIDEIFIKSFREKNNIAG